MTESEYHTVVLVKHDDDGDAYIDFIRKLKSVDLETAIKNAVKEYITTPEGMEHAESEFGYFNYGDASEIPAEITRNHGYERIVNPEFECIHVNYNKYLLPDDYKINNEG